MIRALIFDLDDTLFPEHEYVKSGFNAVDKWLQVTRSIQGFQAIATAEFEKGVRGDVFNRALRRLGKSDDSQLVGQMVEVYRDHQPSINLFVDADRALAHFGIARQLGLLTDGYLNVQRRKVAALNISHRFQAIVYSDEFGRDAWKPSAIPYNRIAETLGCRPSECAYIGDNPAKDFVTAKRLGWLAIRVRRPGSEHFAVQLDETREADADIKSLLELELILQKHANGRLNR
ncbi:MAG TPA: HAD family hydrolase [Verrucomicrobiae bacterium]